MSGRRDEKFEADAQGDALVSIAFSLRKIARHIGWISFFLACLLGAVIGK